MNRNKQINKNWMSKSLTIYLIDLNMLRTFNFYSYRTRDICLTKVFLFVVWTDGNLPVVGITNPVYTSDNQNVSNIEREIHRQQQQSNYQRATSCNQNEVACSSPINDLTVAKNVSLPVNGACASGSLYDDDNDSDRYTTLKDIQAKLDEINITGRWSSVEFLSVLLNLHLQQVCSCILNREAITQYI